MDSWNGWENKMSFYSNYFDLLVPLSIYFQYGLKIETGTPVSIGDWGSSLFFYASFQDAWKCLCFVHLETQDACFFVSTFEFYGLWRYAADSKYCSSMQISMSALANTSMAFTVSQQLCSKHISYYYCDVSCSLSPQYTFSLA